MKEKIVIFAIGLFVGAVLSTGAFLVFSKTSQCNMDKDRQIQIKMDDNRRMQDRDKRNMPGNNNQNGQPEMPNNGQNNN